MGRLVRRDGQPAATVGPARPSC